ncbi:MAG: hypothetical protein K2L87_00600 [Clostridiales bacterium]|nr:hypothetical protein [Clostridiales bacterium]
MKKRIAKIVTLFCTLALAMVCVLALVACGGTTYTYSKTDVKMTGDNMGVDMSGTMNTMYDNMFKGSTLDVSDSEIVWTVSDQKSSMEVKKDGDKYVLSGDYVDQMKQALSASMGGTGVSVDFDMYGTETDAGFDIVMATTSTSSIGSTSYTVGMTITVSFVK